MRVPLPPEPATERYARHLVMPEVGLVGQERLAAARVLLVGLGGLGSPAALYLAAAGIGTMGLLDDDSVERSNLQRQVLYGERDLGRSKVDAAADRLSDANPLVHLELHRVRLTADNAPTLVGAYDVVLDGSDNFATRYLVNDACVLAGRPDVYGSVLRFGGQVTVFDPPRGPCYRCLHPTPPPPGLVASCAEAGVLGAMPGVVGALQAMEALKLVLGIGDPLRGRLLLVDALGTVLRTLRVAPDPGCPLCGPAATIHAVSAGGGTCPPRAAAALAAVAGGAVGASAAPVSPSTCVTRPAAPMVAPAAVPHSGAPMTTSPSPPTPTPTAGGERPPFEIDVQELAAWRAAGRPHLLLDVRTPHEATIATLAGSLLIPLQELPRRLGELTTEGDLVVYCHHGGRSAQATTYLRHHGFVRARNLAGGIDAWAEEIDPKLARY